MGSFLISEINWVRLVEDPRSDTHTTVWNWEGKKKHGSWTNLKAGGQLATKSWNGEQMCGKVSGLVSVSGWVLSGMGREVSTSHGVRVIFAMSRLQTDQNLCIYVVCKGDQERCNNSYRLSKVEHH